MPDLFDAKAATWDDDPQRRALAMDIVAAIRRRVPLAAGQRLLDLGCGTGLIGLPLAASTGALLGVDLSAGMVARFRAKAAGAGLAGVAAEVRDLVADPLPPASIDLAVSAMAFHHIEAIGPMLAAVARCLAPGGWLAVADLETEDGSFHDQPVPHPGFDPAAFLAAMAAAGLAAVAQERVHILRRPPSGRGYPIFLALARRPGA